MRNRLGMGILALTAALAIAAPMVARAQDQHRPGGAPPRAAPGRPAPAAARPAPAPRVAPAPHIAAPAAPRFNPQPRMATQHAAPPPRVATPRIPQQRVAPQSRSSAIVNRNVQQHQFRQERAAQQRRPTPIVQSRPNLQAQQNRQAQRQLQLNNRQQLRAERTLRRQENRELRRLPASQRAQRREQIQQARQQRALARQQLAQPNSLQAQPNSRTLRANRRDGAARVTADAARNGRFASHFAQRTAGIDPRNRFGRNRFDYVAARQAWRHGHRAAFVAWYGPVFWPYAYSDIFDYAFWPYGYDDGFWAYAYDDFFDGIFWGEAGPPADYAYAAAPAPRPSYAAVQELCRQPGNGITAWPFADIERKVGLNADQRQLLDDMRRASQDAAAVFKASCPAENSFPLTPPGRLNAMMARLDATLQAVDTVRPALEKFYASLSDEQKERFNQLGPKNTAANAEASETSQSADACKQPKPGLANLPIEKIEDVLNPSDAQQRELNKLQDATAQAVSIMQAACPDETPITPPGRLQAMEKRLQAMIDAAKTVKPSLESFYASLSNEQKARFNRIGQQLSQGNG